MRKFAQKVLSLFDKNEKEIIEQLVAMTDSFSFNPVSVHKLGKCVVLTANTGENRCLLVVADCKKRLLPGFEGEITPLEDGGILLTGECNVQNAIALKQHFPWCAPTRIPSDGLTVGIQLDQNEDKSLSTARESGGFPVIFATLTAAVFAVFSSDNRGGYALFGGVAATVSQAEKMLAAGATLIGLHPAGGTASDDYADKTFVLDGGDVVKFSPETAKHCSSYYGNLPELAGKVAVIAGKHDLGIVLDETDRATTPAEHLFIVRELHRRNIDFAVLFLSWSSDPTEFENMLRSHMAIARTFAGYRLAVPAERIPKNFSASDKELHLGYLKKGYVDEI
ncbi:MAG: tagaturonate epimerase family protein [Victivallales bacterium]|jgi:hypothetical protein|nr:tagaturonate epimerase family protein [Victivallales bacterium]